MTDERDEQIPRARAVLVPDAEATLTAEAKDGFDPEVLVRRPVGPSSSDDPTTTLLRGGPARPGMSRPLP